MSDSKHVLSRLNHDLPGLECKKVSGKIERIDKAKRGIREGNYLTNAEADKIAAEWLKKLKGRGKNFFGLCRKDLTNSGNCIKTIAGRSNYDKRKSHI